MTEEQAGYTAVPTPGALASQVAKVRLNWEMANRGLADAVDALQAALEAEQRGRWAAEQDLAHWQQWAETAENALLLCIEQGELPDDVLAAARAMLRTKAKAGEVTS